MNFGVNYIENMVHSSIIYFQELLLKQKIVRIEETRKIDSFRYQVN